jgi:hypothetical protein
MKAYVGNRRVALLILNVGVEDQVTAALLRERTPLYTEQEAGWAPEPVYIFWTKQSWDLNPGPFIQQPTRYMDYAFQAHVQIRLQWRKKFQNNLSDPSMTVDVCVSERADKIMESMDCFTLHSKRPSSDQSDLLTQFISVTCRLLSLYLPTNATITTTTPDFRVLSSPPRKW